VLPDEADIAIGIELRRVAKLLTPEQIKGIRSRFKLSQKRLAELLDIAESTVCRWETGAQIQQRTLDKMLRAYAKLPSLRAFLEGQEDEADTPNGSLWPADNARVTINLFMPQAPFAPLAGY